MPKRENTKACENKGRWFSSATEIKFFFSFRSRFCNSAVLPAERKTAAVEVQAVTDRNARESNMEVGDTVLLKADKANKLTSNFDTIPRTVVEKYGGKVGVENDERNMMTQDSLFVRVLRRQ